MKKYNNRVRSFSQQSGHSKMILYCNIIFIKYYKPLISLNQVIDNPVDLASMLDKFPNVEESILLDKQLLIAPKNHLEHLKEYYNLNLKTSPFDKNAVLVTQVLSWVYNSFPNKRNKVVDRYNMYKSKGRLLSS